MHRVITNNKNRAKPAILGPNKWPAPGARLGPGLGPMRFSAAPAAPAPPASKPAPQADDDSDSSDSDSGVD